MHEIHKSQQAEIDLINIWLYGNEQWGAEQADLYLDQLDAGLGQVARFPESGVDCSDLRERYRALKIGRHIIFYKVENKIINVIRVLHQSMDYDRHL